MPEPEARMHENSKRARVQRFCALSPLLKGPPGWSAKRIKRPRSEEYPDDETFPGLLLARPEGRIFFVNAERIGQKVQTLITENQPKVVALDLSAVFDLEYTALKMLTEAEKRGRLRGIELWLVGLNPQVLASVQRSALGEVLGRHRMLFSAEIAVDRFHETARGGAGPEKPPASSPKKA